jgi:hypothetical protein
VFRFARIGTVFLECAVCISQALRTVGEGKKQRLCDDLSSFYEEHKSGNWEIIQIILYGLYRVYENSRVV